MLQKPRFGGVFSYLEQPWVPETRCRRRGSCEYLRQWNGRLL